MKTKTMISTENHPKEIKSKSCKDPSTRKILTMNNHLMATRLLTNQHATQWIFSLEQKVLSRSMIMNRFKFNVIQE